VTRQLMLREGAGQVLTLQDLLRDRTALVREADSGRRSYHPADHKLKLRRMRRLSCEQLERLQDAQDSSGSGDRPWRMYLTNGFLNSFCLYSMRGGNG